MAAAFRPVNSPLTSEALPLQEDVMHSSPATPRPSTAPHSQSAPVHDDSTTPTRAMFSNTTAVAGQKPLPTSPFPQAVQMPTAPETPKRDGSQGSAKMHRRELMDIDMEESDGEVGAMDDGSDDDSVNADGTRSSKKKKSQRFYCTDYPPCNLSFTRSEHLARHIRKHTGERPFQCHCSRRFSRLDNLRQHAQTVHVNEDIPIDSLAATGSRFQRQIRTDRVRQAGNRARASTGGSAGGPARGHSKSLSTSSINSVSSVGSAFSTVESRRRPPPLVMADPRARPGEPYRANPDHPGYMYRPPSPSDFSTPTSATFSTEQGSPRWASSAASPSTSHSRSQSMYTPGTRTPGRRLSVPSGVNPFQAPHGLNPGRPMFGGHGAMNSSNSGAFSPSSSLVSSPTVSTSGWSTRRDSTSSATEDWRRRTWHPDSRSYVNNSNQLNNVANQSSVRPNPPPPIANPSNTQSTLQLPGIESFDNPTSQGPLTPPRRHPSPMAIDSQQAISHPIVHQVAPAETVLHEERRNLNMYDASLQRGLNRLDISHNTPPRDSTGGWNSEVGKAAQAQGEQVRTNQPTVRFEQQMPPTSYPSQGPLRVGQSLHQQTMSAPSISSSRDGKRRGWYNGPVTVHREEVPRSQQDPRVAHVDRMVHPNFTGFSGFPAREPQQPQHHATVLAPQQQPLQAHHQHQQPPQDRPSNGPDSLRRLEALVAVATSEGSTATAY